MPYTAHSTLGALLSYKSSTPYKNSAERKNKKNFERPPRSQTQSRSKNERNEPDGRYSKANLDETSSMKTQEARAISHRVSSIQAWENDDERDSILTPKNEIENVAISETPERQKRYALEGPELSISSPWGPTQTPFNLAESGGFSSRRSVQSTAYSTVNYAERDEAIDSKLYRYGSGEDPESPTGRCVPESPKFKQSMDTSEKEEANPWTYPLLSSADYTDMMELFDRFATGVTEASHFVEFTSTNTDEESNKGSWKSMRRRSGPTYDCPIPPVQCSSTSNLFMSSPRYSLEQIPAISPRGYYRGAYRIEHCRRANFAHVPPDSHGKEPVKYKLHYTSEEPYSNSHEINSMNERWRSAWAKGSAERRREILLAHRYGRSYERYCIPRWLRGPRHYKIKMWPRKDVLEEKEDVKFPYQDLPQTIQKLHNSGANSSDRILSRRRQKRGHGEEQQHGPLDSSLDVGTSAEKLSLKYELLFSARSQLIGRHQIFRWKLHCGKSKEWRRKPSAKTSTSRQFLTAISSHKQLHYSLNYNHDLGTVNFDPDIPVAVQRSKRGKTSTVVRNACPVSLPWMYRKRVRDSGHERNYTRDILGEGELVVEVHRKFDLQLKAFAEIDSDTDYHAYFIESKRQLEVLQACPSSKIIQNSSPSPCLQLHYVGRVIPGPYGFFELLEHTESSAHADVYRTRALFTEWESYARIYTLRGIHPNQRKRRVANMKRFAQQDEIFTVFDWEGKKVCTPSYWYTPLYTSLLQEYSTPKVASIGAIGRRNTKEYNEAFPPLPTSTPISFPTKLSKQVTAAQQLQMKTLEIIKSELEETNTERWKSASAEPIPLAQRLMIRLMELNVKSVAKQRPDYEVRNCEFLVKEEGNDKSNADGEGKDLEMKRKKKRGRKKKNKKDSVV